MSSPDNTLTSKQLSERLQAAIARRRQLLDDRHTNVARLFNSAADGIDGLVIEKLGPVLVVQLHEGRLKLTAEALRESCRRVAEQLGVRAVYRKVFPAARSDLRPDLDKLHHDSEPWIGQPTEPELAVLENGLTFLVRPYDGYATGMFLDHHNARSRVRQLAAGGRVLNAFAYTCGFTLAAAAGGAQSTVSVDVAKKCLEWGKRNVAANNMTDTRHQFICSDIFDYYARAERQDRRFDLIILDPPTFARVKRPARTFSLSVDLDRLIARAIPLLACDGHLHVSLNHRGTSHARLERTVRDAARAERRRCVLLEPTHLPDDFHGDCEFAKSILARLA